MDEELLSQYILNHGITFIGSKKSIKRINIYKMTFEIEFEFNSMVYKADVTFSNKDFLVNFNSPQQYSTWPTIVFTIHQDESMNYDASLFEDKTFMPAIAKAIKDYIHSNKIIVE